MEQWSKMFFSVVSPIFTAVMMIGTQELFCKNWLKSGHFVRNHKVVFRQLLTKLHGIFCVLLVQSKWATWSGIWQVAPTVVVVMVESQWLWWSGGGDVVVGGQVDSTAGGESIVYLRCYSMGLNLPSLWHLRALPIGKG